MIEAFLSLIGFFLIPVAIASADMLLLTNGHRVEGVIVRENSELISIDIGGGAVDFLRSEVREVKRATPDETEDIYDRWNKRKKKTEIEEVKAKAERAASMEAWRRDSARQEAITARQEEERRRLDASTKAVPLRNDQGHIMVDASINGDQSATLVVDTGSPTVLLTSAYISRLKLEPGDLKNVRTITVLNGDQQAAFIVLKTLKIGEVEESDVPAVVLLKENRVVEAGCRDGLLGLSFLNRFHTTVDQTNNKLYLRNISAR